jgi:hypothetical protein
MARIPRCLAIEHHEDEVLIVLEDLDASGYPLRKSHVDWNEIDRVLQWLAEFHASFLGKSPDGLWEQGTYWHLVTRPQELKALTDRRLKRAAPLIDQKLKPLFTEMQSWPIFVFLNRVMLPPWTFSMWVEAAV